MTGRRSVNIYDYPEHLNPFFEDDNHTKLRFWTNTKRKSRSNSFSFQSIKDFKQSLGRSFSIRSKNKKRETSVDRTSQSPENEAAYSYTRSPIPNRQTMPSEVHTYRADVTPLPRIRFHERVRNLDTEKTEKTEKMEKTEKPASPTDDTNPFKDEEDIVKIPSTPSTLKPTTPPRKKKRAPPPPPMRQSSLTRKSLSAEFSLHSPGPKDITTSEINHKDVEQTEENITRTKIEITKIENVNPGGENKIPEGENKIPEGDISKTEISKTEISKTEISKTEISKTEISRTEIPKTDVSKPETSKPDIPETDIPKIEITEEETKNPDTETEKSPKEETASNSEQYPEETDFEINYNSELNISSSEISVSSETRLELQQHLNAVEDSSDLLELVQKLQLEVEKLTDDTNNNVISPNFDSGKRPNFYGYDDENEYTKSRKAAPSNINLNDDDDDVVTGVPLSPRLVRLKKDHEWIKH